MSFFFVVHSGVARSHTNLIYSRVSSITYNLASTFMNLNEIFTVTHFDMYPSLNIISVIHSNLLQAQNDEKAKKKIGLPT